LRPIRQGPRAATVEKLHRAGGSRAKGPAPGPPVLRSPLPWLEKGEVLFPLPDGLQVAGDLLHVRKVVAGLHSQHLAQGFPAALIVQPGTVQIPG